MAVIATGGLSGGGGRFLGSELAKRIGADYVDRVILSRVAKELQATVEALHEREERPITRRERFFRVVERILENSALSGSAGEPYLGGSVYPDFLLEEYDQLPQPTATRGYQLDDDSYIEAVKTVINGLAANGNVVIVGRGAHIILRDKPDVLRVGLIARLEDRIERVIVRENLSEEQATNAILNRDRARAYYFKRFFNMDNPDDPDVYHFVINTTEVNVERATELIIQASKDLEEGRLGYPS